MDPRQMVALRKALESAQGGGAEGAESADEMTVQCPECGCQFVPEPDQDDQPQAPQPQDQGADADV